MYFAVTVSKDNMLDGLQKYLRMDGLTFKITTIPNWQINPDTLYNNIMNKYLYRNLNNPDVYYNQNIIALLQNYRSAFIQLANYYATVEEKEKVREIFKKLNDVMPPSVIPFTNSQLENWVNAYQVYSGLAGIDTLNIRNFREDQLEDIARVLMTLKEVDGAEKAFMEILQVNPDNIQAKAHLVDIYASRKQYDKSIEILEEWLEQNPKDASARRRIEQYRKLMENENKN
jgi:tetratricopeptide (TPR) repeat protein